MTSDMLQPPCTHLLMSAMPSERLEPQDTPRDLDGFLASVEARAYRMAYVATGNREEALDIVQDAMLRLVQSYSARSSEQWPPLFYRILQNRITDWHRKATWQKRWMFWKRHEDGEEREDEIEQLPAERHEQPSAELQRALTRQALDGALHQLPLRQQQAFLLRQWEGLSVSETAAAMGCSEGSVKTHTARAMASLRSALAEHYSSAQSREDL